MLVAENMECRKCSAVSEAKTVDRDFFTLLKYLKNMYMYVVKDINFIGSSRLETVCLI